MMILMALISVTANGHNDNLCIVNSNASESLYGEWWLVGWNDQGTWVEADTNYVCHQHLSIEIPEEGYVMAYSMVNEIHVGLLTLNGSDMTFSGEWRGVTTKVGCNVIVNLFFEDHICKIKSYQLEGNLLKLYYTDDDYFVFTSDFDDSEEYPYQWKDGPIGLYIGEVTAVNDDEIEVNVISFPSGVSLYYRTRPPLGGSEVCRFAASDLAGHSFKVGDKAAFRIVRFRRLKVETGKVYQLIVEPCSGSGHVTDRTGTMHNDRRMGWIIIDDEVNENQGCVYYYPLKTLAEEYLMEGQPVKFSGELYSTGMRPWDNKGKSDCYYLEYSEVVGLNLSAVRNITTATDEASSRIYNLQGHRLNGQPQHGIFIKDKKKYMK